MKDCCKLFSCLLKKEHSSNEIEDVTMNVYVCSACNNAWKTTEDNQVIENLSQQEKLNHIMHYNALKKYIYQFQKL